jgi:hypothetical protein
MLDRAYETIGKWVGSKLKPLEECTAQLKADVAQLKADVALIKTQPSLQHAGVWAEGKRYKAGNFVTHAGGMWL